MELRTASARPWQRATPDHVLPDAPASAAHTPPPLFNAHRCLDRAAPVSGGGSPTAHRATPDA